MVSLDTESNFLWKLDPCQEYQRSRFGIKLPVYKMYQNIDFIVVFINKHNLEFLLSVWGEDSQVPGADQYFRPVFACFAFCECFLCKPICCLSLQTIRALSDIGQQTATPLQSLILAAAMLSSIKWDVLSHIPVCLFFLSCVMRRWSFQSPKISCKSATQHRLFDHVSKRKQSFDLQNSIPATQGLPHMPS